MPQFLIREFTDSTGYVHVNVEQPRENERMTLVEAEDKEEAKEKFVKPNKNAKRKLPDFL
ncbi:DUF1381 domain-containing protein [Staphylococcus hominis]|uniref:DUF1381 domain-containing protein n=1 Tax=Staphylococcus hominis TaxID=1290 RepID=UPI003204819A